MSVGARVLRCGEVEQAGRRRAAPPAGSRAIDQDGVVAGDGADDVGQRRRGRAPRRGTARRRAGCAARRGWPTASRRHQQLGGAAGPAGRRPRRRPARAAAWVAALGRHGVDRSPPPSADLDRAELVEVAGQRGLGDLQPVGGEQPASSACERTAPGLEQLDDAAGAGRSCDAAARSAGVIAAAPAAR